MFRNVRLYTIDNPWPDSEEALAEALESVAFRACGPLTERSSGFESAAPDAGDALARRVGGADLLRLRSQSRVLPAAAINEELEARIVDYRERMQEDPTPREKRRMKAEVRDELMPKSMLKSDRIHGYVDIKTKILGVDAAQPSAAERFTRRLQAAFGDLVVKPLQFDSPVSEFLTAMFLGDAPRNFAVGRECRMRDAADASAVVRWSNFDLGDATIRLMSFVLDENGVLTKIKFLGVDDVAGDEADPVARQDAEFVLFTGTMRALLEDLRKRLC
jgi:recombination associated protein RdgC